MCAICTDCTRRAAAARSPQAAPVHVRSLFVALLVILALVNVATSLSSQPEDAKLRDLHEEADFATFEHASPSRSLSDETTMFCIPSDGNILVDVRWEKFGPSNDTVALAQLGGETTQRVLLGPGGQANFSGLTNDVVYVAQLQAPTDTVLASCMAAPTTNVPDMVTKIRVDAKDGWRVRVYWAPSEPPVCGYLVVCAHATTFQRCSRKLPCQASQYNFYNIPTSTPFKCVKLGGGWVCICWFTWCVARCAVLSRLVCSVSVWTVNGNGETQARASRETTLWPPPAKKPIITRVLPRIDAVRVQWQQDQGDQGANAVNFSLSLVVVGERHAQQCNSRTVVMSASKAMEPGTSPVSYAYDMDNLCGRVKYLLELRSSNGHQWSEAESAGPVETFGLPGVVSNTSLTISHELTGWMTWLWRTVADGAQLPHIFFRIFIRCGGSPEHVYTTNTSYHKDSGKHSSNRVLLESSEAIDLTNSAGELYVGISRIELWHVLILTRSSLHSCVGKVQACNRDGCGFWSNETTPMAVPSPEVRTYYINFQSKTGRRIVTVSCATLLVLCCLCTILQHRDFRWSGDAAQLEARIRGGTVTTQPQVHVRGMALFRIIARLYTVATMIFNILCIRWPGLGSSSRDLVWVYCIVLVVMRLGVFFNLRKLGREKRRHASCRDYNYARDVAVGVSVDEWSKQFHRFKLAVWSLAFLLCDPGILMFPASRLLQKRAQREPSGDFKFCTSESLCCSVRQAILQSSAAWSVGHVVFAIAAAVPLCKLDLHIHGHVGVVVIAQGIAVVGEIICCYWSWKYRNCSEQQTLCMEAEACSAQEEGSQHEADGFSSTGNLIEPLIASSNSTQPSGGGAERPVDSAVIVEEWYWGIVEVSSRPGRHEWCLNSRLLMLRWGRWSSRQYTGSKSWRNLLLLRNVLPLHASRAGNKRRNIMSASRSAKHTTSSAGTRGSLLCSSFYSKIACPTSLLLCCVNNAN